MAVIGATAVLQVLRLQLKVRIFKKIVGVAVRSSTNLLVSSISGTYKSGTLETTQFNRVQLFSIAKFRQLYSTCTW